MERIIRTALAALIGAPLVAAVAYASTASAATVTIAKYVNGQPATASSTGSYSFPMHAAWTGGSGSFSLSPTGFNNSHPYQATTNDMATGTSYSVNEVTPTSCSASSPYVLDGYSTGTSLAAAAAAQVSSTSPNFTNLQGDQYVIVRNKTCAPAPQPVSPANNTSIASDQLTSVSWTAVSDSALPIQYFYEVSGSSTVNTTDGSFVSPIYQSGAIASTSLSVANTAPGTYYWHVHAKDAAGNYSPWGAVSSLTVTSSSGTTTPPVTTGTSTDAISGTVFNDQNRNRHLDSGEQGISGAQLVLLSLTSNAQPQTVTADANGNYSLSNLPAGAYLVLAKLQQGDVPTVWPHVIRLDGTTSVTDQNFGERAIYYNHYYGFPFGFGFGLGLGHFDHNTWQNMGDTLSGTSQVTENSGDDQSTQGSDFGTGSNSQGFGFGNEPSVGYGLGNDSNAGYGFGGNMPGIGFNSGSSSQGFDLGNGSDTGYGFSNGSSTQNDGFGMILGMLGMRGFMR